LVVLSLEFKPTRNPLWLAYAMLRKKTQRQQIGSRGLSVGGDRKRGHSDAFHSPFGGEGCGLESSGKNGRFALWSRGQGTAWQWSAANHRPFETDRSIGRITCPSGMMYCHTIMPKTKVALTLDAALIDQVDDLVAKQKFRSRSQAVEAALSDKLRRLARTRLAREAAKLNPVEEKRLADEGLVDALDAWPEY
jgi:Arc/MetJ-type ribon-helix-helix transcriptional regulator